LKEVREIASIRKRGKDSYQITVSVGVDELGNRKRFCKTVRRDPGLTDKEWEKELRANCKMKLN
jgi:integrase